MIHLNRDRWVAEHPDDPSGRIIHLVRKIAFSYSDHIAEAAAQAGLHPTDLRALAIILDADRANDNLTVGALTARLPHNQPTVSALVDRLEQHGMITRQPVPSDRRKVALSVTETGKDAGWKAFGGVLSDLHTKLSQAQPDQLAATEGTLAVVLASLEPRTL